MSDLVAYKRRTQTSLQQSTIGGTTRRVYTVKPESGKIFEMALVQPPSKNTSLGDGDQRGVSFRVLRGEVVKWRSDEVMK